MKKREKEPEREVPGMHTRTHTHFKAEMEYSRDRDNFIQKSLH